MSIGGPSGPSIATGRPGGPLVVLMVALGILLIVVLALTAAIALGIGPFAGPGTAPLPSANARASERPATSERPDASAPPTRTVDGTGAPGPDPTRSARPTVTPRPPASPGTPLAELFSHVPLGLWSTCTPGEATEVVVATVDCAALDGAVPVSYTAYASSDAVRDAYSEYFRAAEIDADSGRCYEPDGEGIRATPNRWPAEHSYSIGDEPVGRYVCLQMGGEPVIAWTDDRFDILAVGRATAENLDRFVTYWLNEAGPVP